MNEFTAKKLGEVLAFCQVGIDTFTKGKPALEAVFNNLDEMTQTLVSHANSLKEITTQSNVTEITLAKAQKTGDKLKLMRELYVGDEWDNPAELLEWSGFFEGAAVVHWALVVGAATTTHNAKLLALANVAQSTHIKWLDIVSENLNRIGQTKAKS